MHVHKNLKCVLVLMDFLSSKRKLSLSLSFIARKTMMFIIKTQSHHSLAIPISRSPRSSWASWTMAQNGQNKTVRKSPNMDPSIPFSCLTRPRIEVPATRCSKGTKYAIPTTVQSMCTNLNNSVASFWALFIIY